MSDRPRKIGILSDVHGNLAALRAVLRVLDEEGCDSLICLGDTVGYGASPAECIEIIREREIPCVLGNHDDYVCRFMDPVIEELREDIQESIQWTRDALSMDEIRWLAGLPKRLDLDGFSVVHGSFGPKLWTYAINRTGIGYSFLHQDVRLSFCGHTHVPVLADIDSDGTISVDYLMSAEIPSSSKVLVNVGSVGQPRDLDPRAACLIYDADESSVRIIRTEYDIGESQRLIREAGLPEVFATRLKMGR